jgi:hypothetical protein
VQRKKYIAKRKYVQCRKRNTIDAQAT